MQIAILMGSDSDWPRLEAAVKVLREFGVEFEARVLSAHRTPGECVEFIRDAENRGVKVFITAAGLAAHLPGVVAAHTRRPVIGLPIGAGPLNGNDALLSIVQMPPGVPVATVGIDNAKNAALLAVQMLAVADDALDGKLAEFKREQAKQVLAKDAKLQEKIGG
ncbi:MAG: 5-(carboxyamino)imidazole ribonucleotide mutase [Firmicutes bacterium]|nr:5-(carboxyamino)imidazole ribonucleotide mutase [Bacillota bacterium]